MVQLTNRQARQFILLKHGLLGAHKFHGKQGALDFIRQAGCIQFDPVDLCGRNAELTLQSRIKGLSQNTLHELLYRDRALFDYPDKQLSIIPTEIWPYFERFRQAARAKLEQHPEIEEHIESVRNYIAENGAVCSNDFTLEGSTTWWSAINWSSGGRLSRSVLEQMYSSGDLVIEHKKGTRRYYDLAEKHIPAEMLRMPEPLPDEFEHQKWRVLRRIGAVGLLWNRPSDAWLNIWGLNSETRDNIFRALLDEGKIIAIAVDGLKSPLYCRADDLPLIEIILADTYLKPRCELIAPLDPLIWDRKLVRALFGFAYAWEIYTPPDRRRYGVYVLPLLQGECFIGRVEAVRDRKNSTLMIKNIWYEDEIKQTKKQQAIVDSCLKRFARFHGCKIYKK